MRVAVIGTGYVGLATGATLAYLGHDVTCMDIDSEKVSRLLAGEVPIHEPGLPELMAQARPRLAFTTRYAEAMRSAEVVFIAVGTPSLPSGEPDLDAVRAAADGIGRHLGKSLTVIVNKSTVPIGCGNWVALLLAEAAGASPTRPDFIVASNPEFLSEGQAVHDALYPSRIVVGVEDDRAVAVLRRLYEPLLEQRFPSPPSLPRPTELAAVPLVTMDLASAELVKYAANAFLALKISFVNDIGALAERVGADVVQVATGMGLDARIGPRFLQAGVGWGGSCFGKDTAALMATAREYGLELPTVRAAREVNARQRARTVEKLQRELKILKGRIIALLGLAFKPHTDDLRDAPALEVARELLARGARVRGHDPVARPLELAPPELVLCRTIEEALRGADAIVVLTEWPDYTQLDWRSLGRLVRGRVLVDARNCLDRDAVRRAGFRYLGIGRSEAPAEVAEPVRESVA